MATTAAPGFWQGARDGYPLYAMVRRPSLPGEPSRGYGAGMLASGLGSIVIGTAPLAALLVHSRRSAGKGVGTIPLVVAGIWAVPHVLGGAAGAVEGANILAGGRGAARDQGSAKLSGEVVRDVSRTGMVAGVVAGAVVVASRMR